jgi:hypothetical protein
MQYKPSRRKRISGYCRVWNNNFFFRPTIRHQHNKEAYTMLSVSSAARRRASTIIVRAQNVRYMSTSPAEGGGKPEGPIGDDGRHELWREVCAILFSLYRYATAQIKLIYLTTFMFLSFGK